MTAVSPLTFTRSSGDHYQLPDAQLRVLERSVVDDCWAGITVDHCLLTVGDDQYVGYYNTNKHLTVAHRRLDSSTWTRQVLDTAIEWDSHNSIAMALDSAGHLHVSGNMHAVPLIYYRTTRAGEVSSLTQIATMVEAATEVHVTYPTFMYTATGDLVFRHRSGFSGNGDDLYNRYDPATQTWSRLLEQPLHSGEGLRNAYVSGPVQGPDGFHHLTWVWRDSGDAATNQRLSYARSRDLETWERSDGRGYQLPITFETGEIIDDIAIDGGIINGNHRPGWDCSGRPVIAYHAYDEAGCTQVYAARRDAAGWTIRQLSNWSGRWEIGGVGTLVFEVELSGVRPIDGRAELRLDVTVKGEQRTFVLDADLRLIAEVATPGPPREVAELRSDFPGMRVLFARDPFTDQGFLARWEARPAHHDLPWPQPWPDDGPLEVYRLG